MAWGQETWKSTIYNCKFAAADYMKTMKLPLAAACALAAAVLSADPERVGLPSTAHAQQRPFDAWLQDFRSAALEARISPATVDVALAGLTPLEQVIERDRAQPEFTLDFRSYLARVVSQSRIEEGQRVLAEHGELLRKVGRRYGMPPELLAAVWGIESNYGRAQGDFPVVQALATLAYDGRRAPMFRRELLHALRILDLGHVELDAMKGSWAGAMGQLQFMPSTFIDYAKDGDGDGRKDVWGSTADALESAANFMSSNWRSGLRWGRQASVPAAFNTSLAGLNRTRTLPQWQALGVRLPGGEALPRENVRASIIFPDNGTREPAFLVYQNYRALLRWNRAHFFALAVGHLADRIAGGPPLAGF
jgi:membrane-bound lytic murein transglycosylase B